MTVKERFGAVERAVGYLAGSGGTSVAAACSVGLLLPVFALCVVGVGLPLVPSATRAVRPLLEVERRRVSAALDVPVPTPYRALAGTSRQRVRAVLADPATWRDLAWLVLHGATGFLIAVVALGVVVSAVALVLAPAYWWLPTHPAEVSGLRLDSWPAALAGVPLGIAYGLVAWQLPHVARAQAAVARRLLAPAAGVVLGDRVAELTASRAAALEAHGAELRRIERDLHDGTQARIAAVIMQLGIAESVHDEDPAAAMSLLRKAQDTATDALAELRDVLRAVYPPVLSDRGLAGAVTALAARCPVPCALDVDGVGRQPAAVEAAAYFVVAEALTNITKHSRAEHATVGLRSTADSLVITIGDDGRGGADPGSGSGLAGIRRRAEAFDGSLVLVSPPGGPTELRVELPCGS
ncbi:sensor histidine kinase [Umezawaea sp. Da 62-37]|uniref:sensor histidine kinase n=1 Tax=Umezawaea sp. Da 62-37 TaxID=3075927 RepID=UPI0028F6EB8A|nr:sensor histidine kinase [Umezawaea sp. Da 62-37]WNV86881.1 sensor histidine kinase [Umezawaea sp. Da 62-37]